MLRCRRDLVRGGENPRRAGQRQLDQEEAVEAAGIDGHHSAIGDVVDGKAVECRAIMQRDEIARSICLRLEPVRTENATYLFSRFIDIVRCNTAIGRKPRRLRSQAQTAIRGGICSHDLHRPSNSFETYNN